MTRFSTFMPTLGLTALAALSLPSVPAAAQDYAVTVTDLHPASDFNASYGSGIFRAAQVGYGTTTTYDGATDTTTITPHALLWTGSAASVVDLKVGPPTIGSVATGVDGDTQVGFGFNIDNNGNYSDYKALLWHGTPDSVVDLTPSNQAAQTLAVSGNTQVGIVDQTSDFFGGHAFLWHGTASSAVDLNPAGIDVSEASGVSGTTQVGDGYGTATGGNRHAFLWRGTAVSAVDLTPPGFSSSRATAVFGTAQVGYGAGPATGDATISHALLWHGAASSMVDLNPPGFDESGASAVSGGTQVGYASLAPTSPPHAFLWRGTAKSGIDLNRFLPARFQGYSRAQSVDDHDGVVQVVGTGRSTGGSYTYHAFLWKVVFAPTLQSISPTTRTAGTGAFTLTVTGTRFTHASFIRCTQTRLPTTFVNSEHLQAVVPASFITQHGTTFYIQVSTPGVDTAGVQVLTIR